MYLTRLKLDPDKRTSRQLRIIPYLLHQAVFRAFPNITDGGPGRVLYRMDTDRRGKVSLLVQSEKKPDWDRAELLKDCLAEPIELPKDLDNVLKPSVLKAGQCLYFCLRANPTIKKQTEDKKNGYRLGLLREQDQTKWLHKKAEEGGFTVLQCRAIPEGMLSDEKRKGDKLRHYAVRFEGVLRIATPELFVETIKKGIGSAKGFGFGLLSIAPFRSENAHIT